MRKILSRLKRIFFSILFFPDEICHVLISGLPGEVGFFLRYYYWKMKLKSLGSGVRIDTGVYFQRPRYISIGANTWIDKGVFIMAGPDRSAREKLLFENQDYVYEKGCVFIGKNTHVGAWSIISGIDAGVYISDDCTMGAGCRLYSFTHHYRSIANPADRDMISCTMGPLDKQCLMVGPIFIGRNVGMAMNTIILPGVSILGDSFVYVNSVLMKSRYAENSLIGGCPAVKVGKRFRE